MPTELESWLDALGLGQYAPVFAANAVDLDIVGDLTDTDLISLGVAPLGHRKRLLKAIAEVQRARLDNFTVGLDHLPTQPRSQLKAERRQVTVLFCDLADSTAWAERTDPEDWLDALAAYHAAVREVAARWGGFVARVEGDGVDVYFR